MVVEEQLGMDVVLGNFDRCRGGYDIGNGLMENGKEGEKDLGGGGL